MADAVTQGEIKNNNNTSEENSTVNSHDNCLSSTNLTKISLSNAIITSNDNMVNNEEKDCVVDTPKDADEEKIIIMKDTDEEKNNLVEKDKVEDENTSIIKDTDDKKKIIEMKDTDEKNNIIEMKDTDEVKISIDMKDTDEKEIRRDTDGKKDAAEQIDIAKEKDDTAQEKNIAELKVTAEEEVASEQKGIVEKEVASEQKGIVDQEVASEQKGIVEQVDTTVPTDEAEKKNVDEPKNINESEDKNIDKQKNVDVPKNIKKQKDDSVQNITKKEKVSNEQKDDFSIGDIVWAKLGRYPYWPSIVCIDPDTDIYLKGTKGTKNFALHVRFCNDGGRRSWIKNVETYLGKDSLIKKYPNCLSFIKNNKKQMDTWNMAVVEANRLVKLTGDARLKEYIKTLHCINGIDYLTKTSKKADAAKPGSSKEGNSKVSKEDNSNVSKQDDDTKKIAPENSSSTALAVSKLIMPESFVFLEDISYKVNQLTKKKPRKRNLPKKRSKKNESDSDSEPRYTVSYTNTNPNRTVSEEMKNRVRLLEEACEQENKGSKLSKKKKLR